LEEGSADYTPDGLSRVAYCMSICNVVVRGCLSVREGQHIAHAVENAVLKKMPQVEEGLVHIEPEEELSKNINAEA
jgi:divalent metal cation (Fe/Co/Zn/Cd) transporter